MGLNGAGPRNRASVRSRFRLPRIARWLPAWTPDTLRHRARTARSLQRDFILTPIGPLRFVPHDAPRPVIQRRMPLVVPGGGRLGPARCAKVEAVPKGARISSATCVGPAAPGRIALARRASARNPRGRWRRLRAPLSVETGSRPHQWHSNEFPKGIGSVPGSSAVPVGAEVGADER